MPQRPAYNVTLTDAGGRTPPEIRLRGALKALLRRYGLRATSIKAGSPTEQPAAVVAVDNLPAPGTSPAAIH